MIEINMDATSLGWSACLRNYKLKTIDGYKQWPSCPIVYGSAVHKFAEVMFKTNGQFPTARDEAIRVFKQRKQPPAEKKFHLGDDKHLQSVCYNLWFEYIQNELTYELLMVPQNCWYCDGKGCPKCEGKGTVVGPAVELSFRFSFYSDSNISVYLCGTIDKLGKFKNGCYAIGDWKVTSAYKPEEYLEQFAMHRQLRVYNLALKYMARLQPDSILGKVGKSNIGAFIDGVFLKTKPNETLFKRSDVQTYSPEEMEEFEKMLVEFCQKISKAVSASRFPKEGIVNGMCSGKFNEPCEFWHVCRNNPTVAATLLARDFQKENYNPLTFRE